MGKYQVGWSMNPTKGSTSTLDTSHISIYKNNTMICSFPIEEAKEVARLMMSWCGLNAVTELTDRELMEALKERGYSGKLNLNKEFEL